MKKQLLMGTLALLLGTLAFGQYQTVVLNYDKAYFGENQSLPAGRYFIVTGVIGNNIPYVEVKVFNSRGMEKREPIYETFWKRPVANATPAFNVPINYKLRDGQDYDFLFNFYRTINENERKQLVASLHNTLDNYIDQSFATGSGRRVKLTSNTKQVMTDLNKMVDRAMNLYRSRTMVHFTGFSDIVKRQIEEYEGRKLKTVKGDNGASADAQKAKIIADLKTAVHSELAQYLNAELYILADDKYIDDYPTEDLQRSLAVNAGYGGAVFNVNDGDFKYGHAPYAGISFPLGRSAFASPFWNRTSLSLGVFITDLNTDSDNAKVSGPIIKRPSYVGLGYRIISFLKVNAGATFLERPEDAGTITGLQERVSIRPMIGLSAELNLSVGVAK